jgi:hypothetical protein
MHSEPLAPKEARHEKHRTRHRGHREKGRSSRSCRPAKFGPSPALRALLPPQCPLWQSIFKVSQTERNSCHKEAQKIASERYTLRRAYRRAEDSCRSPRPSWRFLWPIGSIPLGCGPDLNTIWFILVGVLFTGYAMLDGFDLGIGALHLFTNTTRNAARCSTPSARSGTATKSGSSPAAARCSPRFPMCMRRCSPVFISR